MTDPVVQQLVQEHGGFVRSLAAQLLREHAAADDLAQETWVRALRSPPKGTTVRAWLAQVMRRLGATRSTSGARRARRERMASRAEATPSAADEVARRESLRHVAQVVADLDEPYRGVILQRFYEGLPPRAIAAARGVPVATVKSQLQRGLARVRCGLEDRSGRGWTHGLLLLTGGSAGAPVGAFGVGSALMAGKVKVGIVVAVMLVAGWVWLVDPMGSRPPTDRDEVVEAAVTQPASRPEVDRAKPVPSSVEESTADELQREETIAPRAAVDAERAVVFGRVIDELGGTVVHPRVSMRPRRSRDPRALFGSAWKATGGRDGVFELTDVPPGEYLLSVEHDAYVGAPDLAVSVPSVARHELRDVVLSRGRSISLTVTDEQHRGVAGVAVYEASRLPNGARDVTLRRVGETDSNGVARLHTIDEAATAIACVAPAYVPRVLRLKDTTPATTELAMILERGWSARGIVRGAPSGAALRVTALPTTASSWGRDPELWAVCQRRDVTVDPSGRFEVHGLPDSEPFYVKVEESTAGGLRLAAAMETVDRAHPEVELDYVARAAITIAAVDASTGEAVVGVQVGAAIDSSPVSLEIDETVGDRARRVFVEPADALTLTVSADGYEPAELGPLVVHAGQHLQPAAVSLRRAARLRVRVIDRSSSRPVVGARVWLSASEVSSQLTLPRESSTGRDRVWITDAAGEATLSVAGDAAELRVVHPDFVDWRAPLDVGAVRKDQPIVVELAPAASVTVWVVDPHGRRSDLAAVQREGLAPREGAGKTEVREVDRDGKAVFVGLEAGRHRFRLRFDQEVKRTTMVGGAVATVAFTETELGDVVEEVDLLDGEAREVELAMPALARVYGAVRDSGTPVPGAKVGIVRGVIPPDLMGVMGTVEGLSAVTDELGEYSIEGVLEGDVTLIVEHGVLPLPMVESIAVRADETRFDADLPGTHLRGVVTGPEGPVAGAEVGVFASTEDGLVSSRPKVLTMDTAGVMHLDTGEPDAFTVTAGEDGRFEFHRLPARTPLSVRARHDLIATVQRVVTLGPSETRDLMLAATPAGAVELSFVDAMGDPMINVMVTAEPQGMAGVGVVERFSSGRSEFRVAGLAPGVWKIRAVSMSKDGGQAERNVDVVAGEVVEAPMELR